MSKGERWDESDSTAKYFVSKSMTSVPYRLIVVGPFQVLDS